MGNIELNSQTLVSLVLILWSFLYLYNSLTAKDMILEFIMMFVFTIGVLGLFKKLW